jgi:similar to stage IV sporulation protein
LKGRNLERLLNALRGEGVALSRITRLSADEMRLSMPAKDFKKIRRHANKLRCKAHIEQRSGAPFVARRAIKRPVLWIGCLVAFAALALCSTRIWVIRIEGNTRVAEATIQRALTQHGLHIGAARPKRTFDALADAVAAYDERIAWVGLKLSGVCLTVSVLEAEYDMLAIDPTLPCNVVAVKDGVLTKILTLEGVTSFKVGDYVKAGDLLISGTVTLPDVEEPMRVHARGVVKANVYYFSEYAQSLVGSERLATGATAAYRRVEICGLTLSESDAPFADYEIENLSRTLLRVPFLPITVWEGRYCEMAELPTELSIPEAAELALVAAENGAMLRVPSDAAITQKTSDWFVADGLVIATCAVVTEESIGLTEELSY